MKFRRAARLILSAVFVFALVSRPAAADPEDELFLSVREAVRKGDRASIERLAGGLREHELAAYVDFWRLQATLKDDPDPSAILAFLKKNEGDYLAERMRGDWLKRLGRQGQWSAFDAEFPALKQPDQELACHALQSRLARGDTAALGEAMPLWLDLVDPPEFCLPVIEALILARRVKADDVWARIRRQVEANRLPAARYSMNYLPPSQTPDEKTALAVTDAPLPWLAKTPFADKRMHRELTALAIARIARSDPALAAGQLEELDSRLHAGEKQWAWSQIAWQAARRHMDEAQDWFRRAGATPMSGEAAQWRARAALRAEDWDGVLAAIEKMPAALSAQPVWIYWQARAHLAAGRAAQADALFGQIAGRPDFYGNLADEELGRAIAPPTRAAPPTRDEMAKAEANGSFRRALAFFRLDLRTEAVREWNWGLRGLDDRALLAAAALAERAGIHDRAIVSAERTRAEHDYAMRYLSPYASQIRPAAREQALDEAWVYGLMRQESRFVTNARSSAGASGLMQLMPATARWTAKKIGLKGFKKGQVYDVETNLLLGMSYLRLVLERLDSHPLLASAGYNAGPNRARKWQAERALEGAIYAETIPFTETRDYVKKVMSNAVYSAALFTGEPLSLKRRLAVVGPRVTDAGGEELP
ncbi:MAG: lytic transglycosylase domain-containing protein [Candidatus Accumulibacter sp.]|nr:lytic transglycosylase domain-containing protein [Accumulibacter sp.]